MAMCRRLVLGLVIFMVVEQPSWLNSPHGNWKVQGQRVAGNCKSVMFPFGPAVGDTTYPSGFDVGGDINAWVGPIVLPSDIMLIGEGPYNNAFINAQGVISFEVPHPSLVTTGPVAGTSTAMIMVNPMDLVSTSIADGNIFYRLVGDAAGLADIQQAMDDTWDPTPIEWALIVTWSCVRRNGGPDDQRQTFQFVLTAAGPIVPTFHNFAEVHTDTDMIIGVQAEGVFLGGAVPSAVLLENYNTCPCGRWAAQVETSFIAPASTACSANTCAASTPPADCLECTDFAVFPHFCEAGLTRTVAANGDPHPDVSTYDGSLLQFFTRDKFLFTRTLAPLDQSSPCKLQIRVGTTPNADGIAWGAVAFGVHKNPNKFRNNLVIGKTNSGEPDIVLRGQGVQQAIAIDVTPGNDYVYDEAGTLVTLSTEDRTVFTLTGSAPGSGSDCQYRVVYTYADDDDDHVTVSLSQEYSGALEGICGSCDGDLDNDFVDRFGNLQPDTEEGRFAISNSWID